MYPKRSGAEVLGFASGRPERFGYNPLHYLAFTFPRHRYLRQAITDLARLNVLDYDEASDRIYQELRQRLRVGSRQELEESLGFGHYGLTSAWQAAAALVDPAAVLRSEVPSGTCIAIAEYPVEARAKVAHQIPIFFNSIDLPGHGCQR